MKFELKTKRLIIKPRTIDEMKTFYESQTDEHLGEAYKEMYDACVANEKLYFWYTNWAIVLKDTETEIGSLGIVSSNEDRSIVEIGYGIDDEYAGNGYCTEAVKSFCDWALSQSAYFITAETEPDNEASRRVLEKVGFKDVGDHYRLERGASSWTSIYMCLGMPIGLAIGEPLFDNMSIGMCLGLAIGVGIGAFFDAEDRKKRKRLLGEETTGEEA